MAKYNPNIHHRRSIRLKGYDYSRPGLYFVTIVCQNREHFFGKIENGKMILNDAGKMVNDEWLKLHKRFHYIRLHEYIVMPNHFHAILEIIPDDAVGATLVVAPENGGGLGMGQPRGVAPMKIPTKNPMKNPSENIQKRKTLGDIMGAFQSITTVKYIQGVKTKDWKRFDRRLWQRNYWEHIIRNEKAYNKITKYIKNNPKNRGNDKLNFPSRPTQS